MIIEAAAMVAGTMRAAILDGYGLSFRIASIERPQPGLAKRSFESGRAPSIRSISRSGPVRPPMRANPCRDSGYRSRGNH